MRHALRLAQRQHARLPQSPHSTANGSPFASVTSRGLAYFAQQGLTLDPVLLCFKVSGDERLCVLVGPQFATVRNAYQYLE